jgi:hypothetical protein
MIRKIITGTFFKAVLVINALMVLLPVFFLLNSSLRETGSFAANPIELARKPAWSNFTQVWAGGEFPIFLKNSLIVTLGSLVVILICALVFFLSSCLEKLWIIAERLVGVVEPFTDIKICNHRQIHRNLIQAILHIFREVNNTARILQVFYKIYVVVPMHMILEKRLHLAKHL